MNILKIMLYQPIDTTFDFALDEEEFLKRALAGETLYLYIGGKVSEINFSDCKFYTFKHGYFLTKDKQIPYAWVKTEGEYWVSKKESGNSIISIKENNDAINLGDPNCPSCANCYSARCKGCGPI